MFMKKYLVRILLKTRLIRRQARDDALKVQDISVQIAAKLHEQVSSGLHAGLNLSIGRGIPTPRQQVSSVGKGGVSDAELFPGG